MQIALVKELRLRFPNELVFAIPNGGYRSWRQGKRLKLEGARPGIPDLCCPMKRGRYSSLWVELKQPSNKPSPDQAEIIDDLNNAGCRAVWCTSYEDAFDAFARYFAGTL